MKSLRRIACLLGYHVPGIVIASGLVYESCTCRHCGRTYRERLW